MSDYGSYTWTLGPQGNSGSIGTSGVTGFFGKGTVYYTGSDPWKASDFLIKPKIDLLTGEHSRPFYSWSIFNKLVLNKNIRVI
jgi:hypothetical protein